MRGFAAAADWLQRVDFQKAQLLKWPCLPHILHMLYYSRITHIKLICGLKHTKTKEGMSSMFIRSFVMLFRTYTLFRKFKYHLSCLPECTKQSR